MLRDGQLAGELPSENELRRRMCVSRTTVRKVLRELVNRELVTERHGLRATAARSTTTTTIRTPKLRLAPNMSNSSSWSGCCGVTPGPEPASMSLSLHGNSVLRPMEFANS
ncbi:GntR family transcriptional regulator [Mesorhizobium sp. M0976]|uniref:GntR family transcriptional regulator n=1 Tax=unclassified Mesorhizobium TaxID=325217 RepID=UPI00333C72FC